VVFRPFSSGGGSSRVVDRPSARSADDLAKAFEEIAERLPAAPLNLAEPGRNAQQAQASAERAQQTAQEAAVRFQSEKLRGYHRSEQTC
jgi:hypothetical protein